MRTQLLELEIMLKRDLRKTEKKTLKNQQDRKEKFSLSQNAIWGTLKDYEARQVYWLTRNTWRSWYCEFK